MVKIIERLKSREYVSGAIKPYPSRYSPKGDFYVNQNNNPLLFVAQLFVSPTFLQYSKISTLSFLHVALISVSDSHLPRMSNWILHYVKRVQFWNILWENSFIWVILTRHLPELERNLLWKSLLAKSPFSGQSMATWGSKWRPDPLLLWSGKRRCLEISWRDQRGWIWFWLIRSMKSFLSIRLLKSCTSSSSSSPFRGKLDVAKKFAILSLILMENWE